VAGPHDDREVRRGLHRRADRRRRRGRRKHLETVEADGNLLLIGGVSAIWQMLIGNGTATGGAGADVLQQRQRPDLRGDREHGGGGHADDAHGAGGEGDGRHVPAAHGQTGTAGSKTITFRSTFASADANQAWNEWGIDNGTRMLNRKVAANGTKASGQTWQFTVTVALA
jgi:hypothetical protein